MAIPKPPKPKKQTPKAPPKAATAVKAYAPKKNTNLQIGTWDGADEGDKCIYYGRSGMGKTTLLAQLDPVFIGIDDGGRKLTNPLTGGPLRSIKGIKTFQDVRDALQSVELLKDEKDVVIDTITKLQPLAEQDIFATIGRGEVSNLEEFGYGKGYKHLFDTMYSILGDCDELIRHGINVHVIAQLNGVNRANAGGDDYLEDGPNLYHGPKHSVRNAFVEWADHIFYIDHSKVKVSKTKKATSDKTRVIFIEPEIHFLAKSRTIDETAVQFDAPDDVTLWKYLFPERFPSE